MQLLNGYINEVKELSTKFGQRIVMKCVIGGRETEVWRSAKDADCLLSIPSGTQAQFTYDSKGKYHLVDGSLKSPNGAVAVAEKPETIPAEPVPAEKPAKKASKFLSDDQKRDIGAYVTDMADLYGFCLKTAGNIDGISDNDRRQIATTLFISAREKFSI